MPQNPPQEPPGGPPDSWPPLPSHPPPPEPLERRLVALYEDRRNIGSHRVTVNFTATTPLKAVIYVERSDGIVLLCWSGAYPSIPEVFRDAAIRIAHMDPDKPVSILPPPYRVSDPDAESR